VACFFFLQSFQLEHGEKHNIEMPIITSESTNSLLDPTQLATQESSGARLSAATKDAEVCE